MESGKKMARVWRSSPALLKSGDTKVPWTLRFEAKNLGNVDRPFGYACAPDGFLVVTVPNKTTEWTVFTATAIACTSEKPQVQNEFQYRGEQAWGQEAEQEQDDGEADEEDDDSTSEEEDGEEDAGDAGNQAPVNQLVAFRNVYLVHADSIPAGCPEKPAMLTYKQESYNTEWTECQAPEQCKAGTFSFDGYVPRKGACTVCEAGKYQPSSGKTECDKCAQGRYCDTGSSEQGVCPAGYFCSDPFRKELCKTPGAFCPAIRPASEAQEEGRCQAGYFCTDSTSVQKCTQGHHCAVGSSKQAPCPAAHFCLDPALKPLRCEADQYAEERSTACSRCVAEAQPTAQGDGCECRKGFFSRQKKGVNPTKCEKCPKGQ